MAPSATTDIVPSEVGVKQFEHVHGAENKTPLEAISHGGLVQPGEKNSHRIGESFLLASVF